MVDSVSQEDRAGALATPLGKDVLVLKRFEGAEGLGELFEYRIEALSTQANIDFNSLIGLNLSVHLKTVDQVGRDFSGVLVEARWTGKQANLNFYRLVLRPWLWLLSRTSDCRIFSSKKVTDIILKVFQDRGFTDYRNDTTESYPTLEYCVQYRETDLNFVCRLMEEYGIYYFFEYEKGDGSSPTKHTLVLADAKSCHKPVPGLSSVKYLPTTDSTRRDAQQFDDWWTYRGFQSGRFVLNDYDYEKPGANLVADAEHSGGYAHGSMEMYDYPGDYDDQGEGKTLAKVKLDADQSKDQRRTAFGSAPSLLPGYTINRTSVSGSDEDKEYLLLRCNHTFGDQSYESTGGYSVDQAHYSGTYELASSDRQFRSPQVTRKSIIQGPQTAKVVGQQGEEIDVDKEGRICVQFFWDRKKKTSRRVRVGQVWAGHYQRSLFIPRIGDEVVVHYLEGDPDRPMVVGSVYNGNNTVPVDLPANKTKSGMNTDSSKGHSGRNVFSFEDKAGEEYVNLRAQKDLKVKVLNDETRTVGHDQTESVSNNLTQQVGANQTLQVGQSYTLTAMEQIVLTVGLSSMTINPSGITLVAPTVTFVASGSINSIAPEISIEGMTTIAPMLTATTVSWGVASGPPPVPPV